MSKEVKRGESTKAKEYDQRLQVFLRIRPLLPHEFDSEVCVEQVGEQRLRVNDGYHITESVYDGIFSPESKQFQVFEKVEPLLHTAAKGYNCTLFAYGQTGSGKTFTMFGSHWENAHPRFKYQKRLRSKHASTGDSIGNSIMDMNAYGIIPRAIQTMFEMVAESSLEEDLHYTVSCCFLQIYNEKIYDLLGNKDGVSLRIREDKKFGNYVENLSEYIVQTSTEAVDLLRKGERNRAARQTHGNLFSSRSHTIFQLNIETQKVNKKGNLTKAKLNFCDLAGSEKWNKEDGVEGLHLREMTNINLSLTTLGKVISALVRNLNGKKDHIPYRDSQLTRFLRDSLGGNTKTCLVATVAPTISNVETTLSTLKFADRAKQLTTKIRANEISAEDDQLIQKLQREVMHLKGILKMGQQRSNPLADIQQQLWALKEENLKLKDSGVPGVNIERLMEENKRLKLELQRATEVQSMLDETKSLSSNVSHHYFGDNKTNDSTNGISPLSDTEDSKLPNVHLSDRKQSHKYEGRSRSSSSIKGNLSNTATAAISSVGTNANIKSNINISNHNTSDTTTTTRKPLEVHTRYSSLTTNTYTPQSLRTRKQGDVELPYLSQGESLPISKKSTPRQNISTGQSLDYNRFNRMRSPDSTLRSDDGPGSPSSMYQTKGNSVFGASPVIRMRGPNNKVITTRAKFIESAEENNRKRELKLAKQRLRTLESLEQYRAAKLSKEIERLKDQKRAEEDRLKAKKLEEERKRRKIDTQRRRIERFKAEKSVKQADDELNHELKRYKEENKRKEYHEVQKKRVVEYREKKRVEEQDRLEKLMATASFDNIE